MATATKTDASKARIVVAVDESLPGRRAFDLALTRSKKAETLLVILTVGRRYTASSYSHAVVSGQEAEDSRCKQLLRRFGALAKSAGARYKLVYTHAEQGLDIGEALVNYLTTRPASELYLGRRSLSGFDRFFLGSVSKYVVEHAPCNVTVVPCIEQSSHDDAAAHQAKKPAEAAPAATEHKLVKQGDYVYTRVADDDPDE